MDVVHERCAGIDISKADAKVCLLTRMPFECRSEFAAGASGAHDGVGFWTLHSSYHRSHDEQFLVSVHERLHHELIISTPWGTITSLCGTLADGGERPTTYHDLFEYLARWSERVHECFATFFSVGSDEAEAVLAGLGASYRADYQRAHDLCPVPGTDWQPRALFVHAVLRACMAPGELARMTHKPVARWTLLDVLGLKEFAPDRRLEVVARHAGELWRGFTASDFDQATPDSTPVLAGIGERVGEMLAGIGLSHIGLDEHADFVRSLLAEAAEMLPEGVGRYEIVTAPRETADEDLEEHQRERIQFRDRPLRAVPVGSAMAARWRDFALHRSQLGLHTCMYWLRHDLLTRQFAGPEQSAGHILAVIAGSSAAIAGGEALMWSMSGALGPDPVAGIFTKADQRLIVMTSLASLADAPPTARSGKVQTLYALIDLPLFPVIQRWLDQDCQVEWHSWWVDGDQPLCVFLFHVDANPGVVLIHVTSTAGRYVLLRWLAKTGHANIRRVAAFGERHILDVDSLIQHMVRTWWFIDQRAGTAPVRSASG